MLTSNWRNSSTTSGTTPQQPPASVPSTILKTKRRIESEGLETSPPGNHDHGTARSVDGSVLGGNQGSGDGHGPGRARQGGDDGPGPDENGHNRRQGAGTHTNCKSDNPGDQDFHGDAPPRHSGTCHPDASCRETPGNQNRRRRSGSDSGPCPGDPPDRPGDSRRPGAGSGPRGPESSRRPLRSGAEPGT